MTAAHKTMHTKSTAKNSEICWTIHPNYSKMEYQTWICDGKRKERMRRMEDLQKLPSSDWIGGGTQTNIVVAQERAPCAAAIEGGLHQGFMPPVLELRESRGGCELRVPSPGSSTAPCPAVARSTRPTQGERRRQGGHLGPGDDGSGTRGGGSSDWPPKADECSGRQVRPHELGADGQGKRGKKGVEEGDMRSAWPPVACPHRSGLHRRRWDRRRATEQEGSSG
jgi:hypothetical protein